MLTPYGEHPDQIIDLTGNEGPLVVLIHGGYWKTAHSRDHMNALAAKLVSNKFQVANIEYRREPGRPEVTINDVNLALSKVKNAIAIIGFSVGGQLALVSENQIHKLILLAPVTDLERTKNEGLGEDAVKKAFGDLPLDKYDPIKRDYRSHIFIIHGDSDDRVPIQHSRDFAKAKNISLMEISGADHFEMVDPESTVFQLILNILRRN